MAYAGSDHEGVEFEAPAVPSEGAVRAQLERIRASAEFDAPERARRFLSYVVEETLAGRADRIKAYSIAIEVFGRDASFDAQSDPVVRIDASRIRRALERYYLTAGQDDPIVITMPKGSYIPVFTAREPRATASNAQADARVLSDAPPRQALPRWLLPGAAAIILLIAGLGLAYSLLPWVQPQQEQSIRTEKTAPRPDLPGLVVQPFEDLSGTQGSATAARGLTNAIIDQIARFKDVIVVVRQPAGTASETAGNLDPRVRYELHGSVQIAHDRLHLSARLLDLAHRSVVWANSYEKELGQRVLLESETDIAREVATAIAQPYGVIFRADAARVADVEPGNWTAYECTLAYYAYRAELRPDTHASIKACLERAVERYPNYATAWALLSLTYMDELRFRYRVDADSTPSLDRAFAAAKRAVEIDPENVRGRQAQMTALFFNKEVDEALRIAERAVVTNPNDTELVGEYGLRLALSGEWKRGSELMEQVVDRNPGPLGYYETGLAFSHYMQRDYHSARAWIRKANVQANPLYHVVGAAIYGQLGESGAAAVERDWLLKNAPQVLAEIDQELTVRNVPAADQAHFVEGLRKAGLSIVGF